MGGMEETLTRQHGRRGAVLWANRRGDWGKMLDSEVTVEGNSFALTPHVDQTPRRAPSPRKAHQPAAAALRTGGAEEIRAEPELHARQARLHLRRRDHQLPLVAVPAAVDQSR